MLSDQLANSLGHEDSESSRYLPQSEDLHEISCPDPESSPKIPLEPYRYASLDADKKEIRLIRANSRNQDGDILTFEVTSASLDAPPEYTALSYVWESSEKVASVMLNGRPLPVTRSLYRLLTRARVLRDAYMWVDAICINQEDISERNAQVQLMGDVYSNASKVAAYVGEAPKEDVHVVEALVRKIHAHHVAINTGHSLTKANSNWEIKRILSGQDPSHGTTEEWKAFAQFMSQPYFSRCWVLQEVILGRDVEIWFGNASFSYEILLELLDLVYNIETWCQYHRKLCQEIFRSPEFYHHTRIVGLARLALADGDELPFLEILSTSRELAATDPRDKIYALLGLARGELDKVVVPEYSPSNSAEGVCIQFARHCINTQRSAVETLYHAGTSARGNMPSWVPNWTTRSVGCSLANVYNCSGSTKPAIRLGNEPSSISVCGAVVSRLSTLARYSILHKPEDIYRSAWSLGESIRSHGSYLSGERIEDVVRRTLTCDYLSDSTGFKRMGELFRRESEALANSCNVSELASSRKINWREVWKYARRKVKKIQIEKFKREILSSSSYSRLGITDDYLMGVFPERTQVGDVIVIVLGATKLFVFRPVGNAHILIGECYVHGIMDGELINIDEGTEAVEIKGSTIQDLTII